MRSRVLMLALSLSTAVAACGPSGGAAQNGSVAQAGAPAKTDKAADEAAIRSVYQKFPVFFANADTAGLGAMFADDGVEIMAGAPPAHGPDAVKKLLGGVFASMKNVKVTIVNVDVHVSDAGDDAVVAGPYRMSYTDAKGKQQTDRGTTLTVFRKVNGQWKVLYDTNVSEVSPSGS